MQRLLISVFRAGFPRVREAQFTSFKLLLPCLDSPPLPKALVSQQRRPWSYERHVGCFYRG